MRADQLLVERGLAASRSQAVRLIAGGLRWRDGFAWHTVGKNRDDVPETAELELLDAAESRYVSRGGLKLEGALAAAGVDPNGRLCLDIGQSTGGFTDCLLQRGAAHVVGVDVGHGQLHERVRSDARVTAVEGDRIAAADLAGNAASHAGVAVHHQAVEEFLERAAAPAVVIADPPRTGLSRAALDGVIRLRAGRVVYVSCDVATLARDARRLVDAGYTIERADAFDLFPNTPHVETVMVFDS